MKRAFSLNIVTPQKIVFEGKVTSLIVPGYSGYLGVLVDHAPLVTAIIPGRISGLNAAGEQLLWHHKGGGILEVINNTVTLFLDTVPERADLARKDAS